MIVLLLLLSVIPLDPYPGEAVSFDASASSSNCGEIVSYYWDWGAYGGTGLGVTTTYSWDDGFYTVTLIVTDACGNTAIATAEIAVNVPWWW